MKGRENIVSGGENLVQGRGNEVRSEVPRGYAYGYNFGKSYGHGDYEYPPPRWWFFIEYILNFNQ